MSQASQEQREARERRARELHEYYHAPQTDEAPQSAYLPADPPAGSREPTWTTGQGIGFLAALPGWTIVGLAALVAINRLAAADTGTVLASAISATLFGVVIAIPGTIVFYKCKRH